MVVEGGHCSRAQINTQRFREFEYSDIRILVTNVCLTGIAFLQVPSGIVYLGLELEIALTDL